MADEHEILDLLEQIETKIDAIGRAIHEMKAARPNGGATSGRSDSSMGDGTRPGQHPLVGP
jgi:hypothetical protein